MLNQKYNGFFGDFQDYTNLNNEFIVMELAILSTHERVHELRLFKPRYLFSNHLLIYKIN